MSSICSALLLVRSEMRKRLPQANRELKKPSTNASFPFATSSFMYFVLSLVLFSSHIHHLASLIPRK